MVTWWLGAHKESIGYNKFLVILPLLKYKSRYLHEIFSIFSSQVCANLTKIFRQFLNQPASHSPIWQKLWMPLVTVFVEILWNGKKWWGSGPIGVTSGKDFSISFEKWRFEMFWKASRSTIMMSTVSSTVGLRGKQNIFQMCDFMGSGWSFRHK